MTFWLLFYFFFFLRHSISIFLAVSTYIVFFFFLIFTIKSLQAAPLHKHRNVHVPHHHFKIFPCELRTVSIQWLNQKSANPSTQWTSADSVSTSCCFCKSSSQFCFVFFLSHQTDDLFLPNSRVSQYIFFVDSRIYYTANARMSINLNFPRP